MVLERVIRERGTPGYLRSDNGLEFVMHLQHYLGMLGAWKHQNASRTHQM